MAAVAVDDKVASNPAVIKAQEDLEQAKAAEVAAKSALEALESEGGDEGAIEKARKVLKGAGKKVAKAEKNLKFKIKKSIYLQQE